MPDLEFDGPSDRLTILLQLKILAVILIVSNIALGIFAFYHLREVDRKYVNLISQTLPTLNQLQVLTAASTSVMGRTNPFLFEQPERRAEMLQRANDALQHDVELREQVLKKAWAPTDQAEKEDFKSAGETFTKRAQESIGLLSSGDVATASRQRVEVLWPAFNHYIETMTKAADTLETSGLESSKQLSGWTASVSKMMLGIGSWPLLLLCAVLLLTTVFVIVFFIIMRGNK